MVDRVTRVEQQGFFSRVINSFVGILIGFLLVPGSILLITWNEYRTIHRTHGLIQAEKVVAEISNAFEMAPEFDNRLVHVSGLATTEEVLNDGDFQVGGKVLRLERQVEMFQWVERKESKSRDKLGGGKETITTYQYDRKWHRDRVDSESFKQPSGHTNPQTRYSSRSLVALANVVPLLGRMVGAATMLIGFILGSTVSLITISVAWIAVRPIFSISLLAIASIGVYFLLRRRKATEPPMAVLVD